jgi:uncharacterized SAM-binding protein YcdF (DUF218 family)
VSRKGKLKAVLGKSLHGMLSQIKNCSERFVNLRIIGGWLFWPVADTEQKSDLIICLGGNVRARQEKSLKLFDERYAQKLLLTNQSPDYFFKNGVSSSNVYVTDVPGNTFEEAQYCRWFMEEHKIGSALVVSDWWHLRRVKWSFETVFQQGAGKKIRYISA